MMPQIAITRRLRTGFEETVAKARKELEKEGFGVLTEIDVQAKMKEKLDRDMEPYIILGACAPALAWQGLQARSDLGVLLPCNVCIYVREGKTVVSAMEPTAALSLIDDAAVADVAAEASARLHRVVEALWITAPGQPRRR